MYPLQWFLPYIKEGGHLWEKLVTGVAEKARYFKVLLGILVSYYIN